MCWKIIAIITENARNNTHKKKQIAKDLPVFITLDNAFVLRSRTIACVLHVWFFYAGTDFSCLQTDNTILLSECDV
jgi:hypothetical protein